MGKGGGIYMWGIGLGELSDGTAMGWYVYMVCIYFIDMCLLHFLVVFDFLFYER